MNQTVAEDAPKTHHSLLARLLAVREFGTLAALIIMIVIIAAFIPQFRQIENLINVTRNFSFVGIVAMGMTLVILTGGIDLSVGSVWAMTAVLAASLMSIGWPMVAAIAVALLGAAGGWSFQRAVHYPVEYVAVRADTRFAGHRAQPRAGHHTREADFSFGPQQDAFLWIGGGSILGVPNPVIIFVVVAAIVWIVLSRTVWGRRVYAVGGNEKAARLTGLNVSRLKITVYIISSLLAGLAGIVQASYLSSVTASLATGQELSVIAATVIGGVNLAGGEGTVFGVIIGTVMLEILRNGLLLFGIDPYWQGVFVGAIIILAVSIDRFRQASTKD